MDIQILSAVAFPILMIAGGIAAWRMTKKTAEAPEATGWRDDSLDDWRKEREAAADEARATRALEETNLQATHLSTGSEEQQETTKKHQRIGG